MNSVSATDTYLSFLLSLNTDPITIFSCFLLILARILPIMALAPFFGSQVLPRPIKVMFAISFVAILLPQTLLQIKEPLTLNFIFIGYMLKEVLIGFILGFLVSIPFYIAQGSGNLIDTTRGTASLQVSDPTTRSTTGPVGILYNYILIAIFFFIGGPILFVEGISNSFKIIPVNNFINPIFFSSYQLPFWQTVIGILDHVLKMALQLGAPSIIGVLMAEMFLGIANRLAPQVQIVFLGISLKSWVGLGLLAAAWFFILNQLSKESLVWLKFLENTVRQIAL